MMQFTEEKPTLNMVNYHASALQRGDLKRLPQLVRQNLLDAGVISRRGAIYEVDRDRLNELLEETSL